MKKHLPMALVLVVMGLLAAIWYLESRFPVPVEFVLQQPDTLQLVSLDPEKYVERFRDPNDPHAWKELGVLNATTREQKQQIIAAFRDSADNSREPSRCFWPRHAIRAKRDETTLDLVICFECCHARAYVNNKQLPHLIPVSEDGATTFNRLLVNAKIPLASASDKQP